MKLNRRTFIGVLLALPLVGRAAKAVAAKKVPWTINSAPDWNDSKLLGPTECRNALTASYQYQSPHTAGTVLRVESLESTLRVLSWDAKHIKIWRDTRTPWQRFRDRTRRFFR